jgi:hypothetical protein
VVVVSSQLSFGDGGDATLFIDAKIWESSQVMYEVENVDDLMLSNVEEMLRNVASERQRVSRVVQQRAY